MEKSFLIGRARRLVGLLGPGESPDCLGDIARGKLCGSEILVYSELHSLLQRPVENGHGRLPAGILSGNFA